MVAECKVASAAPVCCWHAAVVLSGVTLPSMFSHAAASRCAAFLHCPATQTLNPGRLEFASYLPANCQAALVQPLGSLGVLVVGSDTQRGFSQLDQAWVAAVAEKLEVQLERLAPGSGFKPLS